MVTYAKEMGFWFLDCGLFQVKVQFISKSNDGCHCYCFLDCSFGLDSTVE